MKTKLDKLADELLKLNSDEFNTFLTNIKAKRREKYYKKQQEEKKSSGYYVIFDLDNPEKKTIIPAERFDKFYKTRG